MGAAGSGAAGGSGRGVSGAGETWGGSAAGAASRGRLDELPSAGKGAAGKGSAGTGSMDASRGTDAGVSQDRVHAHAGPLTAAPPAKEAPINTTTRTTFRTVLASLPAPGRLKSSPAATNPPGESLGIGPDSARFGKPNSALGVLKGIGPGFAGARGF